MSDRAGTPAGRLTAEPNVRKLLATLVELGGAAGAGEVATAAGLASSTCRKWLAQLRAAGLTRGRRGTVELTPEGWDAATLARAALPAGQLELAAAIAFWPTAAHQAFVRLAIAGVISRHHLGRSVRKGHPGFIATGRTGTGKTTAGRFVCDVFGLDQAVVVVGLPDRIGGEILGRREQLPEGWRFLPSPLLEQPLVVFDEFDKAGATVQRDALLYLADDVESVKDGTRVIVRAVPILTCNKRSGRLPVRDEYRRRAIVLDTDGLAGEQLAQLSRRLRELEDAGGPPRLSLEQLPPPAARLPADLFDLLRGLLDGALTAGGSALVHLPSIELLALGYAALDMPLDSAVIAAAHDYLTCAETVDETVPGWQRAFSLAAGALVDGASAADALELAAADQLAIAARRDDRRVKRARDDDALIARRAELVAELELAEQAIDGRKLPTPDLKITGKGVRALLRKRREEAGTARSLDRLLDVDEHARPVLRQARELVDAIEARKQALVAAAGERVRNEQTARERTAFTRRMESVRRAAMREEARRRRGIWQERRRSLAQLMPYADEDELLSALGSLGLLTSRQASAADFGGGVTGRIATLMPTRVWIGRDARVVRDGAAFWQAAYDEADAGVVANGGASKPRRATSTSAREP